MRVRGRLRALEKTIAGACPGCRGAPAEVVLLDNGSNPAARRCPVCSQTAPIIRVVNPYTDRNAST